jgi:hypothetical protein
MAKVTPYHTDAQEYPPEHRKVYHDKDNCPDGQRILPQHRKSGMGTDKQHCEECDRVS